MLEVHVPLLFEQLVIQITLWKLSNHFYLLPPEQLIRSRFVNTHGSCGRNISADLHMENLNGVCKDAVANLGANKTLGAIVRIGKVVGAILSTLNNFNKVTKSW